MDVPFSNKFLMPCCVGCSADDDYDDFGQKNFFASKMLVWCKIMKILQNLTFLMESQYIFAHFCQKSLIQKSGFRLPKHWWNLIGKWGVSFPGRVGGCSVQFENSFVYKQAASQILLSSSPASGERRGGEGCSLPATHQNGRSTISNISGNSWDLSSPILRVIGNFTVQWARRSTPPYWDRLYRPHCKPQDCGKTAFSSSTSR